MAERTPEISFDKPALTDKLPEENVKIFDGAWEPRKYFRIRRVNRSPSNRSPDFRKKRTEELSAKLRKKKDRSRNLTFTKRKRDSTLVDKFPSFSIIFRILKYFKKWTFYRSYENLQTYHLQIINDSAIVLPKEATKRHLSIWTPIKSSNWKQNSFAESYFFRTFSFAFTQVYKSALVKGIKDGIEKLGKRLWLTPLFNPNHTAKLIWDIFVFLIIFLKLFAYSVDRCFGLNGFDHSETYADFLTITILILLIDVLVTLNTKFYSSGTLVENRVLIVWNYIKRYLIIDLPTTMGLFFSYKEFQGIELREVNLLLMLKILFCTPELGKRVRSAFVKDSSNSETAFDLLSLGASILISGHVIACLWHFISFSYHTVGLDPAQNNSWLKERGLLSSDWKVKYLHSIYWSVTTMLTVGYGDITPRNEGEITFNILAMFFGCVIFGYSLNRIGEILRRRSELVKMLKEKSHLLHLMSRGMNLSSDLETKLTNYMEYFWAQEKKVDPAFESLIMSQLSSSLRDQVYFETNVRLLNSIPVLSRIFSQKTLFELAHSLRKTRCPPEEYVYQSGSRAERNLFIVLDGRVEIRIEEGQKGTMPWEIYTKNQYFGLFELFTDFPTRGGALATEFSTFFQLSRQDFLSVLMKDPDEYEKFCKIRDDLVLYQNQYVFDIKCGSCDRVDHRTPDCPFLNHKQNKHFIIGRHLHKAKIFRKRFRRKGSKKGNALAEMNDLNDDVKVLLEHLSQDEDFKELLFISGRDAAFYELEPGKLTAADSFQNLPCEKHEDERHDEESSLSQADERAIANKQVSHGKGTHSTPSIKIKGSQQHVNECRSQILESRSQLKAEGLHEVSEKIAVFRFYNPKANIDLVIRRLQKPKSFFSKTINKIILEDL